MSALVNTIGITLGLGVMGLGGWGMIVLINKEPKFYTLDSGETDIASESYASGTLGEKNKDKLVANIEKNENWFNWAHKNLLVPKKHAESSNITEDFKNSTKGYDSKDDKALNKVCDTYYKKTHSDWQTAKQKNKNSVQWFCSIKRDQDIVEPTNT